MSPPANPTLVLYLPDAAATARLGAWFSSRLQAGDCLLLDGPIGAGKSHFARAFIQARLGRNEDVPSPTFTLVQTYDADVEIWHADLYRLSNPDEVMELGLEAAFHNAITLIEWPDRLGHSTPKNALRLSIALDRDGRRATMALGQRPDIIADLVKEWGAE